MRIVEETDKKLIVKNESHAGKIFFVFGLMLALFALVFLAAAGPEHFNKGRSTAGAGIFVLPFVGLVYMFLEGRRNRKALILDADARTVTVVGPSKVDVVGFDEIRRFYIGTNPLNKATQLEFELTDGRRFGTGVDTPAGRNDKIEAILQKVIAKFVPPPASAG